MLKQWCRTAGGSCGATILPVGADDEVNAHIAPGAGGASNGEALHSWSLGLVDAESRATSHNQARPVSRVCIDAFVGHPCSHKPYSPCTHAAPSVH